jgi:photosystem II stability/assembly factor-like uncharacterized protein
MKPQLFIATNGLGLWFSDDFGETINRFGSVMGMYSGNHVWALAADPSAPNDLWVGTNGGVFKFDRAQKRFTHVPSPMDSRSKTTAIAFSPHNPDVILAGTQFAALYRSEDHGKSWRQLDVECVEICRNYNESRFTQIVFDPKDPNLALAGVELDSIWRSTDGGVTWAKTTKGMPTEDIHGLNIGYHGDRVVYASTDRGIFLSHDGGESWAQSSVDSKSGYVRAVVPRADNSGTVFLTNGEGPPGSWGRLFRSRDDGQHWEDVNLPGPVESTAWSVAVNPADPKLIFAATCLGQFYRSTDGGENWTGLKRRLAEIRHVMWLPN